LRFRIHNTEALMTATPVRLALSIGLGILFVAAPLSAQTYRINTLGDMSGRVARILQTNSSSDLIHVMDPATHTVVGVIEGVPHNHGAVLHADGLYYYITNEHDSTVDVVDTRTLQIVRRIQLAARPNNLSGSDLARKVYVAITAAPLVQVIDMDTNEVIKNIPVPGGVHNTFVTPDGRFAAAGMIGAATMSIIDTTTDEVVREIRFDNGVRPFTFDTWPDGSTRRIFVQITGWHGFYVVDWATGEVTQKISPPPVPISQMVADGIQGAPSHGAVVMPDQSAIWISSRATASIYGWSLPDLQYIGRVPVGNPTWLTASPDSRFVYTGVGSHNETAVVDVRSLEVVKRIPVGQVPKRIYTAVFPEGWQAEDLAAANDR
jgi:YVTN family beta-propeller protein